SRRPSAEGRYMSKISLPQNARIHLLAIVNGEGKIPVGLRPHAADQTTHGRQPAGAEQADPAQRLQLLNHLFEPAIQFRNRAVDVRLEQASLRLLQAWRWWPSLHCCWFLGSSCGAEAGVVVAPKR